MCTEHKVVARVLSSPRNLAVEQQKPVNPIGTGVNVVNRAPNHGSKPVHAHTGGHEEFRAQPCKAPTVLGIEGASSAVARSIEQNILLSLTCFSV